jgi:hypothetical protein
LIEYDYKGCGFNAYGFGKVTHRSCGKPFFPKHGRGFQQNKFFLDALRRCVFGMPKDKE